MLMTLIASILGQKGITPETFSVNARVRAAGAPPDVDEDGTVTEGTIAALEQVLGGEPPPT